MSVHFRLFGHKFHYPLRQERGDPPSLWPRNAREELVTETLPALIVVGMGLAGVIWILYELLT